MIQNVHKIIERHGKLHTVERKTLVTVSGGYKETASSDTFTIFATVQRYSGNSFKVGNIEFSSKNTIRINALLTSRILLPKDEIEWHGNTYVINHIDDYADSNHMLYYAINKVIAW